MNRVHAVSQSHTFRMLLAAFGLTVVALFAYAPSARAATTIEQLDQVESILLGLADTVSAMMEEEGEVLGAATATPVPVRPVCRLSLDKKSYRVGESAKMTWRTTGAERVEMLVDPLGGKSLTTNERGDNNGRTTISVTESMAGLAKATIKVTSRTGHIAICSKTAAIIYPDDSALTAKLAPLNAQVAQLASRLNILTTQREKLDTRIDEIFAQEDALQSRIYALMTSSPTEGTLTKPTIEFGEESATHVANSDATEADNEGEFEIEFDVVAVDTDMYIAKTASRGAQVGGANYRIVGADGKAVGAGTTTASLSSTADTEGAYYVVQEGEVETFTLTVKYDPKVSGFYKMGLLRVNWNDTAAASDMKLSATPLADFQTEPLNI